MSANKSNIKDQSVPKQRLMTKLNVSVSEIPIFTGKATELCTWI